MSQYTVTEEDMLRTMVAIAESDGKPDIAALLKTSKFDYDPRWEFSGIVSYQRKLYGVVKVPINQRKFAESNIDYLSEISEKIYTDDDSYYFLGISGIGILPISTEEVEFEEKKVFLEKDSTYSDFASFVINNERLDEIQKDYLFEACDCANNKDFSASTVMLGASCELMLINLVDSYKKYLDKNADDTESSAFERVVVKARCANDRLTEFLKRAKSKPVVLKKYGFENLDLEFSFFNIIRKTRNNSGHPTGISITEDELKLIMTNYAATINKLLDAIDGLPND